LTHSSSCRVVGLAAAYLFLQVDNRGEMQSHITRRSTQVLLSVVFCLFLLSQGAEVSRITHLLHFLNSNTGTEPGSATPKLHPAYYGAETLEVLSKHAGYIQKSLLGTEEYLSKLATFVASLQLNVDPDVEHGGFQAYSTEKKDLDRDSLITTINSYLASRVLQIASSRLGGDEDYFKRMDPVAALTFLTKARKEGVFSLHPYAREPCISAIFYGIQAWNVFTAHAPKETKDSKYHAPSSENTLKYLKGLFENGGFKQDSRMKETDLRSTYQAIVALKLIGQWENFAGTNRKDVVDKIWKFVSAHQDKTTSAFGETPGAAPDVASTFFAVSIAKELGLDVLNEEAIVKFIGSLQSFQDGGFKLRPTSTSGQYANTYYATQTLERLNRMNLLEDTMHQQDRVVYPPHFLPNASFYLMIILALSTFAGALYLVTRPTKKKGEAGEEEEEAEEEGEEEETSVLEKKRLAEEKKAKKVAPTMTIIRNNQTKECTDKDGVPFPIEKLDRKEWDIVSSEDKGEHTIYVVKKKEKKDKDVPTPGALRKRRNK
jgi:hypothetical protein